jgi:hypothetical protein
VTASLQSRRYWLLAAALVLLPGAGLLWYAWQPEAIATIRKVEDRTMNVDEAEGPDPQVLSRVEAALQDAALQGPLQFDQESAGEALLPQLAAGPAFVAKVLYEDGEPVALLQLRCLIVSERMAASSDGNTLSPTALPGSYRVEAMAGEFRLPALEKQYYMLQLWPQAGLPLETCLPAAANEGNPQMIRVTRGITVRGVVVDANDAPVAGAWVSLAEDGESGTATAADGSFALPPMRAGNYRLRVEAAEHAAIEHELHCAVRQPDPLRLRLLGDAVVHGRILPWPAGKLVDCAVELVDARGLRRRAVVAADGSYEIQGVAAGHYHLRLLPLAEGLQAYAAALAEQDQQGIAVELHAGQRLWQELSDPVALLARVRGQAPGQPAGTRIEIQPLELANPPASLLQLLQQPLGPTGEFEFAAVPPGRLQVRLLAANGEVLGSQTATATAGTVLDLLLRSEAGLRR